MSPEAHIAAQPQAQSPVSPLAQSLTPPLAPLSSQPLLQSPSTQPPIQPSPSPTPVQQAMSVQQIKDSSKTFSSKQRDKPVKTVLVPQELARLEAVTLSRASPETELQPSADSGPLEAAEPAKDFTQLSLSGVSALCSCSLPHVCQRPLHLLVLFHVCQSPTCLLVLLCVCWRSPCLLVLLCVCRRPPCLLVL